MQSLTCCAAASRRGSRASARGSPCRRPAAWRLVVGTKHRQAPLMSRPQAPHNPRPSCCRVPPGMRSIRPHKWHFFPNTERTGPLRPSQCGCGPRSPPTSSSKRSASCSYVAWGEKRVRARLHTIITSFVISSSVRRFVFCFRSVVFCWLSVFGFSRHLFYVRAAPFGVCVCVCVRIFDAIRAPFLQYPTRPSRRHAPPSWVGDGDTNP